MLKGFKKLERKLKRTPSKIERNTRSQTQGALRTMRADARARLVENNTIYRGIIFNGFDIVQTGGTFRLVNRAPHAAFVEYGTGMKNIGTRAETKFNAPPLTGGLTRAIKLWMRLKPVAPMTGDLDRSSYLIARSISNQPPYPTGTPPQPFMRPAYLRAEPLYIQRMKGAVRRAF